MWEKFFMYFNLKKKKNKLRVFTCKPLKKYKQSGPGLTTPHQQSKESWAIPSPQPFSPWQAGMETERAVYLFCYQEVIAQSFSGADGPQEEDEDQIQEPPVGHQQYAVNTINKRSFLTINRNTVSSPLSEKRIESFWRFGFRLFSLMELKMVSILISFHEEVWVHDRSEI